MLRLKPHQPFLLLATSTLSDSQVPRPPPAGTWRQLSLRRRDFCQQQKYVGSILQSFNADSARGPLAHEEDTGGAQGTAMAVKRKCQRQGHPARGLSSESVPGLARTEDSAPRFSPSQRSHRKQVTVYSLAEGQPQQEPR